MVNINLITNNKEIVEYLANKICNRKIIYQNGRYHTENAIVAANWVLGLHEIGHWIAAVPSERNNYNLGLPVNVDIKKVYENDVLSPIYQRLYTEEMVACILPLMFYDKYFIPDEKVREKYVMLDEVAKDFHEVTETYEDMKVRAAELFEEYTKNLEININ